MRLKQEELNEVSIKYDTLSREFHAREANELPGDPVTVEDMQGAKKGASDDIDNVRLNEGRGRFYVEAKSVGGGSMLLLRGRKPLYREWMDKHGINDFLKRSQKTTRFRDLVVEKLAAVYGASFSPYFYPSPLRPSLRHIFSPLFAPPCAVSFFLTLSPNSTHPPPPRITDGGGGGQESHAG